MPSAVYNVAFHCADAYDLARFWSQVVGHPLDDDDHPGDPVAIIKMPTGFSLHFEQVPDPAAKSRVHLCLQPDQLRDAEVARLIDFGATIVADRGSQTVTDGSCPLTRKATSSASSAALPSVRRWRSDHRFNRVFLPYG
ncbi:MAG TPA: VOC family protein [Nocardioidaceae bacterium]|nr:VOC family protein [Nocardioidaceae bacterium]